MTSFESTGPTVPGWIREEVFRLERAWPPMVLAAGTALVMLAELVLGSALWSAVACAYYAQP